MRQTASADDPCGDFPGLSAVPVLLGTYGVRTPSPRLEWMIGVIPMRMAMGATISTVLCWRTCRLVAQMVVLPVETGGVEGVAVRFNEKRWVAACSKRLGAGREAGDEVL